MRFFLPLAIAGAVLAQDVDRPFLGVNLRELNAEQAAKLGVEATEGLVVISTRIGSPARVAGVMPLDLLLAVNGLPMENMGAFRVAMEPLAIGDKVVLELSRRGEVIELPVELVSRRAWEDEWLLPGHPMPEFVVDEWIGEGPASEKDLRGSVVVLDFWTMT